MKSVICLGFLISQLLWGHCHAADSMLVVHSFHKSDDWVQAIDRSIAAEMGNTSIEYKTFYMDTMRHPSEAWKKEAARKAKIMVKKYKPKVVIAVDDIAQAYFVRDFVNKSPIQFVFSGVNAEPEVYGYPAANVTGILERTYLSQTLEVLKTLMPRVRRVAVVMDNSTSARLILPRFLRHFKLADHGVSLTGYAMPETFSSWQQVVGELDSNPEVDALLIPLYHTVRRDAAMTSVDSAQVLKWTLDHTNNPVIGLWPFTVENGGLLAVAVDPLEHGKVAAQMAKEILGGKQASDIPMQVNHRGQVMVNLKGKKRYPFDTSVDIDLIADVVIR